MPANVLAFNPASIANPAFRQSGAAVSETAVRATVRAPEDNLIFFFTEPEPWDPAPAFAGHYMAEFAA